MGGPPRHRSDVTRATLGGLALSALILALGVWASQLLRAPAPQQSASARSGASLTLPDDDTPRTVRLVPGGGSGSAPRPKTTRTAVPARPAAAQRRARSSSRAPREDTRRATGVSDNGSAPARGAGVITPPAPVVGVTAPTSPAALRLSGLVVQPATPQTPASLRAQVEVSGAQGARQLELRLALPATPPGKALRLTVSLAHADDPQLAVHVALVDATTASVSDVPASSGDLSNALDLVAPLDTPTTAPPSPTPAEAASLDPTATPVVVAPDGAPQSIGVGDADAPIPVEITAADQ